MFNDIITFRIFILTHEAFNGSAPEYLCDLITKQSVSVRTRRAEDCYLLSVPLTSKSCANNFFERSFMYAVPTLWNKLSQECWTLSGSKVASRQKVNVVF